MFAYNNGSGVESLTSLRSKIPFSQLSLVNSPGHMWWTSQVLRQMLTYASGEIFGIEFTFVYILKHPENPRASEFLL